MRKGVFFTLNFKGLFQGVLICGLVFSFVLMIAFGSDGADGISVSGLTENNKKSVLIIIDPGHGGEDGGTASSKGVKEKDINLSISNKLSTLFRLSGYDILMTRTEDKLIYDGSPSTIREKKVSDIRNRMAIIEKHPQSIFLSIHQNYFTESKYWGAQVFFSGGSPESSLIAESIQNSIVHNIQKDNIRKIKKSGEEIYLLHKAVTPAVMVECGFMSNPSEALLLEDDSYQLRMAVAIVSGIDNYLRNKGEA